MMRNPLRPTLAALLLLAASAIGAGCTQDPCVVYTFRYVRAVPSTGYVNFMESSNGKRISAKLGTDPVTAMSGTVLGNPTSCKTPDPDQTKWSVDVWMSPDSQEELCGSSLTALGCGPNASQPRGIATFDWPIEGKKAVTVGLE